MKLQLATIRRDPELQARAEAAEELAAEYAEAMLAGDVFPPVVVFRDDGAAHWLADGWARCDAAERLGWKAIEADVRDGTRRDALLFACGANASHGRRRTVADKERAVRLLLNDPEWAGRSTAWLADAARVSQYFAGKVRTAVYGDDWKAGRLEGRNGSRKLASSSPFAGAATPAPVPAPPPTRETAQLGGPAVSLPGGVFAVAGVAAPLGSHGRMRYALDSVLVERGDGEGRAVAMDGFRLLVASWPDAGPAVAETVVPLAAWKEAEALARWGEVALRPTPDGKLGIEAAGGKTTARIEVEADDGRYPDWRQLVRPQHLQNTVAVSVDAKELIGLLQAAVAVTGRSVVTLLAPTDPAGWLMLASGNPDGVSVRGAMVQKAA